MNCMCEPEERCPSGPPCKEHDAPLTPTGVWGKAPGDRHEASRMSFMEKNPLVAPVLKWVGGKRQLLPALAALMPGDVACYCEPFVGGGALLFNCQPSVARINDINAELITIYPVIREDVEALITELSRHGNEAKQFYAVRDWDRNRDAYSGLSPVQRAARILYLNKTCYNGLYRVNAAGEFNTPYGNPISSMRMVCGR